MWERIKSLILRLFGHKPLTTDREAEAAALDMEAYQDTAKTNIIAIACNKFATLSMADATFSVIEPSGGETRRTEALSEFLTRLTAKARGIVSMGLGSGIVYVIPYNVGEKIYFDIAAKDRAFITATQGSDIIGLSVLADEQLIDHTLYQRWTDYAVSDGRYIITQKVTRDGQPISGGLSRVEEWRNIPEVVAIEGAERLPIGIFRCPTCGRRPEAIDGVPLCYGTGENINRIAETLYQIRREFELKQTFVGAENNMFDDEGKLPKDGLFKTFNAERKLGSDSFWEVYDPAYRDSSLYNRLDHEFALFEKSIGASKGILTELDTANATATQVRRATIDIFRLAHGVRLYSKLHFLSAHVFHLHTAAAFCFSRRRRRRMSSQKQRSLIRWISQIISRSHRFGRRIIPMWKQRKRQERISLSSEISTIFTPSVIRLLSMTVRPVRMNMYLLWRMQRLFMPEMFPLCWTGLPPIISAG